LAERLKNVLTKLIHPDQKGFVKGRNISEANRMIQDIIQYADEENEDILILASNSFPPGSPGNLIPFISLFPLIAHAMGSACNR
jgi:hypothetical protein